MKLKVSRKYLGAEMRASHHLEERVAVVESGRGGVLEGPRHLGVQLSQLGRAGRGLVGAQLHLELVELRQSGGRHSEELDRLAEELAALIHRLHELARLVQKDVRSVAHLFGSARATQFIFPAGKQLFGLMSQFQRLFLQFLNI